MKRQRSISVNTILSAILLGFFVLLLVSSISLVRNKLLQNAQDLGMSLAQSCAAEEEAHITSFQDAHPRVRYASVRCLGQLATDFQPFLQHELSVSALTAIFSLLHADQPVRVRFITAAALINFVDGAEPAILQPVLGDMLHALLDALPASPILVQKQVSAFSLSFITLSRSSRLSRPSRIAWVPRWRRSIRR